MPVLVPAEAKNPNKMAARGGFKGYGHGRRQTTRKAVVENDAQKQLFEVWQSFINKYGKRLLALEWQLPDREKKEVERIYQVALSWTKDIKYSAHDVEAFSIGLADFIGISGWDMANTGIFISALINNSEEDNFRIRIASSCFFNFLGYRNSKNIIVEGWTGPYLGAEMERGSIMVDGNSAFVGYMMKGGTITVKGTARYMVGKKMKGGTIIATNQSSGIDGRIGERMEGGKIIIKGNLKRTKIGDDMKGGSILAEGQEFIVDGKAEGIQCLTVGYGMTGGSIRVNADVWGDVGYGMKDGDITVEGKAGHLTRIDNGVILSLDDSRGELRNDGHVGERMEGGSITINDAHLVGPGMKGGEIRINGEYKELAPRLSWLERLWARLKRDYRTLRNEMKGGQIYHRGELIVDR